jgi:putative addiction module killer protein
MSPAAKPRVLEVYKTGDDERPFDIWRRSLKDPIARRKITVFLDKVIAGNLGDHHDVGSGVWELRIHHSPGYRIYYAELGLKMVVLCGGTKKTQAGDIARAQAYWRDYNRG